MNHAREPPNILLDIARKQMRHITVRIRATFLTLLAVFLVTPWTSWAEGKDGSSRLAAPRNPSSSSSRSMEVAYKLLPMNCRTDIQHALAIMGLATVNADGAWNEEIATGMVRYLASMGPDSTMAYGWSTLSGAKGLYWHITAAEGSGCPRPPY